MSIRESIREFIVVNFLLDEENNLTPSHSLLESGVIDSTGVLELVEFIENTFAIMVEDEDLVPENLDSIAAIDAFIQRKHATNGAKVGIPATKQSR